MLQKRGIQRNFFTGCKYAAIVLNIGSRLAILHLRNSAHTTHAMYIRFNPKRGIVFLNWLLLMVFSVLNVWLGLQTIQPSGFLDVLMLSIAMCPFTLYGWYTVLLEVNTWEVDADTVRVRDFAGLRNRQFLKSELRHWQERRKAYKYNHWDELRVHTAREKHRLLVGRTQLQRPETCGSARRANEFTRRGKQDKSTQNSHLYSAQRGLVDGRYMLGDL